MNYVFGPYIGSRYWHMDSKLWCTVQIPCIR